MAARTQPINRVSAGRAVELQLPYTRRGGIAPDRGDSAPAQAMLWLEWGTRLIGELNQASLGCTRQEGTQALDRLGGDLGG